MPNNLCCDNLLLLVEQLTRLTTNMMKTFLQGVGGSVRILERIKSLVSFMSSSVASIIYWNNLDCLTVKKDLCTEISQLKPFLLLDFVVFLLQPVIMQPFLQSHKHQWRIQYLSFLHHHPQYSVTCQDCNHEWTFKYFSLLEQ